MNKFLPILASILACSFVIAIPAQAQRKKAAPAVSFKRDIQPIMSKACVSCHGTDGYGGLKLTDKAGFMKGGNGGPLFVKGKSAGSLLYQRIEGTDPKHRTRMPKKSKPLEDADIAKVKNWIDQGAKFE